MRKFELLVVAIFRENLFRKRKLVRFSKAKRLFLEAIRILGCVYTTTIENDLRLHDNEVGPKRNEIVAFTTIVYTTTPENDT